jgi:hypothetical protein
MATYDGHSIDDYAAAFLESRGISYERPVYR